MNKLDRRKFDPSKSLAASKRMTLHGVILEVGDPITEELKTLLGPRRLRQLYENRRIAFQLDQINKTVAPIPSSVEPEPIRKSEDPPGTVTPLGGSWFDVVDNNQELQKINGKKRLKSFLREVKEKVQE